MFRRLKRRHLYTQVLVRAPFLLEIFPGVGFAVQRKPTVPAIYKEAVALRRLPAFCTLERMNSVRRALACASACLLVCAGIAASLCVGTGYVRTEDRNGDGRPDVWRVYDRDGRLREVGIDTNFDGRSDVREYYDRGALIRRESDRNFNDQVDLVEDFDPITHDHTRSVIDLDFDGTADRLELFADGRSVFSKQLDSSSPAFARAGGRSALVGVTVRTGDDPLVSLFDPFSGDTAVGAAKAAADGGSFVGLASSGGLPASPSDAVSAPMPSSGFRAVVPSAVALTTVSPRALRGPPVSLA
jgi:hypothetical protein